MHRALALACLTLAPYAGAQQTPTSAAAPWWHETTALANDGMEGRDTGSEAYERAAKYVAASFAASGLKPAGDAGTFFQRVPMHQVDLDLSRSSIHLQNTAAPASSPIPLRLLEEVTLVPRSDLPKLVEGQLVFVCYGISSPVPDLRGKVAVLFNNTPSNLSAQAPETSLARRVQALTRAGAVAILSIDNPAATEPFHWPAAYARSVTLAGAAEPPSAPPSTLLLRISEQAAARLFTGTNVTPASLFADAEKGSAIPSLPLTYAIRVRLETTRKEIASPNILAVLPGSDPALSPQFVALSAHLDGYGFGTPVLGDKLYNGALDDAAYVATLLELARKQAALRVSERPKRSLLFCIFTGEEKGLLGSSYFTAHPTIPIANVVADLNLDQLRPIFPLRILTMEGLTDSTLGEMARSVAHSFSIELRPDREPERNLFRRADNYNFARVGVPIAGFVFGYDPGSPEERIYRDWYARRYHKPQDDLATPIDWIAAVRFNDFYLALARAVADTPSRPQWLPDSKYRPGAAAP